MTKVWVVRADRGEYTEACVQAGVTGIGWGDLGDLSQIDERNALDKVYVSTYPEKTRREAAAGIGNVWRFLSEVSINDWVITPGNESRFLSFGQVISDYRWTHEGIDGARYHHLRSVDWASNALDRWALSWTLRRSLGSLLTVFEVKHQNEFFESIGRADLITTEPEPPSSQAQPHDAVIEEIRRRSPTEFEDLVGHLLTAMGFKVEVTQPTKDGGVDFEGTLDHGSAAQVNIIGQVKSYAPNRRVTEGEVKNLRGRVPLGAQGTFVTTSDYQSKARDVAEESGFAKVNLVNGEGFVELLTEHWQDLPEEVRDELGLKPILVPA